MISRDSIELFRVLLLENGRAIPVSHPQLVETAIKFEKALKEVDMELSKESSDANSEGSSL